MNVNTGVILDSESFSKLPHEARADYVQIPADKEASVRMMNRHERRAWAAQQRKAAK